MSLPPTVTVTIADANEALLKKNAALSEALANVKTLQPDIETGHISSRIPDVESNDSYRVRVVGQPDLREVKKTPAFGETRDEILTMIWDMEEEIMGMKA